MNILDGIILGLIFLFGVWGFFKGFLQAVGAFFGLVIATVLAGQYFLWLGDMMGGTNMAYIGGFIIIFAVTLKLIGIVFWMLSKLFKLVTVLPFIETFNRSLGALLGLAVGILVLIVMVYFVNKYPFNDWFTDQLTHSMVARVMIGLSFIFKPLLPETLKTLKGVI